VPSSGGRCILAEEADGAGDAGTVVRAVAVRVLHQVLLVVKIYLWG
jgi:hypothetical protein